MKLRTSEIMIIMWFVGRVITLVALGLIILLATGVLRFP